MRCQRYHIGTVRAKAVQQQHDLFRRCSGAGLQAGAIDDLGQGYFRLAFCRRQLARGGNLLLPLWHVDVIHKDRSLDRHDAVCPADHHAVPAYAPKPVCGLTPVLVYRGVRRFVSC